MARRPLSVRHIADATGTRPPHVSALLSDLEKRLFFLVHNSSGDVDWALPVTCSTTQHGLSFSTGESILALELKTHLLRPSYQDAYDVRNCECVSIHNAITAHSRLLWESMRSYGGVIPPDASHLLFEPAMQWESLRGQNILHDY